MPKFPKRLVFKAKKNKQKAGKQQTTTPTMKLKEKDYLGVLSHLISSKTDNTQMPPCIYIRPNN